MHQQGKILSQRCVAQLLSQRPENCVLLPLMRNNKKLNFDEPLWEYNIRKEDPRIGGEVN